MTMTTGNNIILTLTGSSHGDFVGGILKNFPADIAVDFNLIADDLQRRKPQIFGTPRKEDDEPEFLSGIADGITDGADIVFKVKNTDVKVKDYENFAGYFRPSHADYPYYIKYVKTACGIKTPHRQECFCPLL